MITGSRAKLSQIDITMWRDKMLSLNNLDWIFMNHKALFAYNWTKRWGETADGDWLCINNWLFLILSFFSPSPSQMFSVEGVWGGDGGGVAVMSCHNLIFLPPISTLCTNLHILRRRKILFLTVSLVRSQYTDVTKQIYFNNIALGKYFLWWHDAPRAFILLYLHCSVDTMMGDGHGP